MSSEEEEEDAGAPKLEGRLLLVSNRLPISIKRAEDGSFSTALSDGGGLLTGLAGLSSRTERRWYGWPGLSVPTAEAGKLRRRLEEEFGAVPVLLPAGLADRHGNGFSNSFMWPLFHYHPGEITFDADGWLAYTEANRTFARTVAADARPGDVVWVHDYHLMLLPQFLREELSNNGGGSGSGSGVKIGFFLHTPFPSSELYRILPTRSEILRGLLHCDLIGFHTYDYVRHFLSSCARILGLPTTPTSVLFQGRTVRVGAFPIGIDPHKIARGLAKAKVQERIAALERRFQGIKLILGVDRLDYIKGIPQKLHAFEVFLTEHPEWVGKMMLIQVAVPSRQDVEEYQSLRAVVNELVGRINGKFGSIEFMPIHFIHQSVPFDELIALYAASDACVVTSTRDGMNLVSYEYIATQRQRHGVLLLSEFTGAAQCLNGSVVFNPWNTDELAGAFHEAVTMTDENRRGNWEKLDWHVNKYTSAYWGRTFVSELARPSSSQTQLPLHSGPAAEQAKQDEPVPA